MTARLLTGQYELTGQVRGTARHAYACNLGLCTQPACQRLAGTPPASDDHAITAAPCPPAPVPQALRVTLHRSAGVSQLGGTLLALPFVEAPYVRIKCVGAVCELCRSMPFLQWCNCMHLRHPALQPVLGLHVRLPPWPDHPCSVGVACKLPGGRSADEHHLFPNLHGPAPPGALQEPVYVSEGGCRLACIQHTGGLGWQAAAHGSRTVVRTTGDSVGVLQPPALCHFLLFLCRPVWCTRRTAGT